jgi:hypothetical protein
VSLDFLHAADIVGTIVRKWILQCFHLAYRECLVMRSSIVGDTGLDGIYHTGVSVQFTGTYHPGALRSCNDGSSRRVVDAGSGGA